MKKFSFPKHSRLLKGYEFRRVTKYGYSLFGKLMNIQIYESKKPTLKLGLTVPRKYGKATKRNRFKRLVREAFRLSQHSLPHFLHLNIRPAGKFYDELTLKAVKQELSQINTNCISEQDSGNGCSQVNVQSLHA